MDVNIGVLIGQFFVLALGLAALIWDRQRDRLKPDVDQSNIEHTGVDAERLRRTVDEMSRKSNAWRDTWLFLLQDYLNMDAGWHLEVMTNQRLMRAAVAELIAMLKALDIDVSHVIVPPESSLPPTIPPPPPVA